MRVRPRILVWTVGVNSQNRLRYAAVTHSPYILIRVAQILVAQNNKD